MVCWVVSKNLSPHYCCNQKRGYLNRCYSYISETDGITPRPADPLLVRQGRRERRPTWCQNLCQKRARSCQNPILTGYYQGLFMKSSSKTKGRKTCPF